MNIQYSDGRNPLKMAGLSDDQVIEQTREALADPAVKSITIKRLRPKKGAARLPGKNAPLSALSGKDANP